MLDPARTSLSQPHAGKKSRQEFIGAIPVHPPGFGAVCYNRMTQIPFGPDRSSPDILKSLFNTRHRAHAGTFRTCRGVQARPEPRQTMSPARGKPGVCPKSAQQIGRLPFPPFTSQDLLCACQAKQRDRGETTGDILFAAAQRWNHHETIGKNRRSGGEVQPNQAHSNSLELSPPGKGTQSGSPDDSRHSEDMLT